MNPLTDNLFIIKQIDEKTFSTEEEALELIIEKMSKGFTIEYEEYWREYFPVYIIRWFSIVK